LIIEKPCNDDYNAIVEDIGVQNTINVETGELKGFASGYKINSTGKIPTLFSLNINIMHLFKTVEAASSPSWIGPVFAPPFISSIN